MKARVTVTLRDGILDPQGKAIEGALVALGFGGVGAVRQGKVFDIDLAETDPAKARDALDRMCKALLANLVIEDYAIDMG
ncbi:MAG: phosphoribosylformylglycinamidine synthase subunit PurS [Bauldia sp.]|nr:phosphoribosylformylglycinamidine synthase subunit PurS [Bauldia sp.]